MKSNIMYVLLGNSIESYELPKEKSRGLKALYLIDQDLIGSINCLPCTDTINFINVSDGDSIQKLMLDLMPISHIVVCPLVNLSNRDIEVELDTLLKKIFLLIKMIYLPIIRFKESKIWFLDTSPFLAEAICDQQEKIRLLHCYSAGLKAISKVTALELAKKTINANVIRVNEKNYYSKLESLLSKVFHENKLYVTSQELSI